MTPTETTLLWIYAGLIAIWPIRYVVLWWAFRRIEVLTPSSPQYGEADPPLISAIIPARNEEATLDVCLRSVCTQTYPRLEILVVDDRSTDRTREIAQSIAETDPRVRVISIADLPEGWTGKTHALHVAAEQATGDWFWFLDSDTRHSPENLAIVFEYARANRAALASLLLELRCETFWENVVQPLAGIVLMQSYPLFWVNDDRKRLAFANGQYILIERSAYDAAGGHAAVRDRFVEDIAIAERVKGTGRPIRVAVALGIGSTRMYTSLDQMVRGWSRILYDALGRSPWRLLGKILDPLIFSQSGHVAFLAAIVLLLTGIRTPFATWLLGLSVVHHVFSYAVMDRIYQTSVPGTRYTPWFPVANLVMDYILVRSIRMCLTGQVAWRGTVYGTTKPSPQPAPTTPAG